MACPGHAVAATDCAEGTSLEFERMVIPLGTYEFKGEITQCPVGLEVRSKDECSIALTQLTGEEKDRV